MAISANLERQLYDGLLVLLRRMVRNDASKARAVQLVEAALDPLEMTDRFDVLSRVLGQVAGLTGADDRAALLLALAGEQGHGDFADKDFARALKSLLLLHERPRRYVGGLVDVVAKALEPLGREDLNTACNRLIDLAAVHPNMARFDLSAVPADMPVIVGPWTMEVGFELLYWIPFLRAALHKAGIGPERVIAVSRGGVARWYEGVADGYVELFDELTPARFKEIGEQIEAAHEGKKPFEPTEPEQALVRQAAERLNLSRYHAIYPSTLYSMFRTAWLKRFGEHRFRPWLDFQPLARDWARPAGLPFEGDYVAVKFYGSLFFDGDGVQPFVQRLIGRLAAHDNVVLLNTGFSLDDHSDVLRDAAGRVFDASALLRPEDNLAQQTALVAGAKRLYCTYGGFSYLGPLLGVDTLSFFTHTHFVSSHMDVALRAFNREGFGALGFVPVAGFGDDAADALLAASGTRAP